MSYVKHDRIVGSLRHRLPPDYTEVEYIESAQYGSAGPYINTGFFFTIGYRYEFKAEFRQAGNMLFGANSSGSECIFGFLRDGIYNSNFLGSQFTYEWFLNKKYEVSLDLKLTDSMKCTLSANGTQIRSVNTATNNRSFCLFGSYSTTVETINSFCAAKFYYFKAYDSTGLVGELIPAVYKDGTVGMYDTVSGVFKTNESSTGILLAGPIIKHFHLATAMKSIIPSKYKRVEYLENINQTDGIKIENIFYLNADYKFVYDIMPTATGAFVYFLFGIYDTTNSTLVSSTFGPAASGVNPYSGTVTPNTSTPNVRSTHTFITNDNVLKMNSSIMGLFYEYGYTNRHFVGRLYSFKIISKSTDKTLMNLLPVLDTTTNEYGVYDSISGSFYPVKSNTVSSLLVGPEVESEKAQVKSYVQTLTEVTE